MRGCTEDCSKSRRVGTSCGSMSIRILARLRLHPKGRPIMFFERTGMPPRRSPQRREQRRRFGLVLGAACSWDIPCVKPQVGVQNDDSAGSVHSEELTGTRAIDGGIGRAVAVIIAWDGDVPALPQDHLRHDLRGTRPGSVPQARARTEGHSVRLSITVIVRWKGNIAGRTKINLEYATTAQHGNPEVGATWTDAGTHDRRVALA